MKPLKFNKKIEPVKTKSYEDRIKEAKTIADLKVILLDLVPKKPINTNTKSKVIDNGRKFDNR